ncbi:MAG: ABC transporter substrate-binding protein [Synechococcales cyanobacterium]
MLNRRQFIKAGSLAATGALVSTTSRANPSRGPILLAQGSLDKVTYGTNWFAQAEHGGFYQGVATGIYKEYGLDVTVKMGGPQVNGSQLLIGNAIDFFMGSGLSQVSAVAEGLPLVTVAASFQKDPQVLLAHPGQGIETMEDLKGRKILISSGGKITFWPFLKARFGFTDDQVLPYNFSSGPFLQDKTLVQQGYLTSETYSIRKEGGFDPVVLLIADYGYTPYATTIQTTNRLVTEKSDLVQRFVEASIKGWYSYFEDPAPANVLIKQDNPEMTDDLLAFGIEKMKEYGIVFGGDAEKLGVGAMSDARWESLYTSMVQFGLVKADVDYKKAYTLQYINKGADFYQA